MTQDDQSLDDLLSSDPELAASFIAEAREHLDNIEEDFLRLEAQKDNPERALLDKIFRAIHSVKGSAGFLGLDRVTELAHVMETLLTGLRNQEFLPTSEHIDTLLAGVDLLVSMLADIEHCNAVDINPVKDRLLLLIEAKGAVVGIGGDARQDTESAEVPGESARDRAGEQESQQTGTPSPQRATVSEAEAVVDKSALRMGNTVRIHVDILDKLMLQAGELVLVRNQHLMNVDESDPVSRSLAHRLDVATTELQQTIISARMQPIGKVVGKFPRVVRDLGRQLGKEIELEISGSDAELDRTILEALADPLTHIIRNSCGHGIETPRERLAAGKPRAGKITISAYHEAGRVNIEISDDGRGIDPDKVRRKALELGLKTEEELAHMSDKAVLHLVFLPGFSTAGKVGDISGRGVGMDVVKTEIEKLGGSFDIDSIPGFGVTILLRLPLTLAIIPSLVVASGDDLFAIPQVNLLELFCLYDDDVRTRIERADDQEVFRLRNRLLPMVRLNEVLLRSEPFTREVRAEIAERYRRCQREFYLERLAAGADVSGDGELETTSPPATPDTLSTYTQSLNCVVLKAGTGRYGLIVDEIRGTEEIVVKPIHRSLDSLSIYSGITIMGNGKSALILDAEGIARHAGVVMDLDDQAAETASAKQRTRTVLLFRSGPNEQFAVPLSLLRRIESIKPEDIEVIGQREFIAVQGVSTQILRLDQVLSVSPVETGPEMFLVIPRDVAHPVGILISSLVDIEESGVELDPHSIPMDGLLGSAIVRGAMTLFLDVPRLLELFEPEWFTEQTGAQA